jgi:hypothetical protein
MEKVWTMKRYNSFLSMALILSTTMGCTDNAAENQHTGAVKEAQLSAQAQAGDVRAGEKLKQLQRARDATLEKEPVVAPDIRDGWQWSTEEIATLSKQAKSGNMEAANQLSQYYSVHEDKVNADYWEDWLFKKGDPGATRVRVHKLYSASKRRSFDDPQKLIELKEAERLERSVTDRREDNTFLDKLRSEIASIEGSK